MINENEPKIDNNDENISINFIKNEMLSLNNEINHKNAIDSDFNKSFDNIKINNTNNNIYSNQKRSYSISVFNDEENTNKKTTIFILTYNLCGLNINEIDDNQFSKILFPKDTKYYFTKISYPTFYCIALEEVVELNTLNILFKSNKEIIDAWEEKITNILQTKHNYVLILKENLVGILFLIYVKETEHKSITNKNKQIIKKGFFGQTGNKGYIVYNFTYKKANFAFCGGHLLSGEKEKEYTQRKLDLIEILNNSNDKGMKFYKNDFYFIFGDLNFRVKDEKLIDLHNWSKKLNLKNNKNDDENNNINDNDGGNYFIKDKDINSEKFQEFMKNEQLRIFLGKLQRYNITEGYINFLPTFKYVIGTDDYDIFKRHVSWTDRILFKKNKNIEQIKYNRLNVKYSDHKPVYSLFSIKLNEEGNEEKKKIDDDWVNIDYYDFDN